MKIPQLSECIDYALKMLGRSYKKSLYILLLLFFAYNEEGTPTWAKKIVLGSFAYFLSPIDAIPDLTPLIGMTDDLSVLSFGLITIACYINDDIRVKARLKLVHILKSEPVDIIEEIDSWL